MSLLLELSAACLQFTVCCYIHFVLQAGYVQCRFTIHMWFSETLLACAQFHRFHNIILLLLCGTITETHSKDTRTPTGTSWWLVTGTALWYYIQDCNTAAACYRDSAKSGRHGFTHITDDVSQINVKKSVVTIATQRKYTTTTTSTSSSSSSSSSSSFTPLPPPPAPPPPPPTTTTTVTATTTSVQLLLCNYANILRNLYL